MNPRQRKEISDCTIAISRIRAILETKEFCEPTDFQRLMESLSPLRQDIGRKTSGLLFNIGLTSRHLKDVGREFTDLYDSLPELVRRHNTELAATLAPKIGMAINPVEGHDLDCQQLMAIATDVRSRLVVAGAGTGKTTTIMGLAKHLFSSDMVSPEEVLFLSFTNNSVDDLKRHIESEVGCRADVTTFHRLGMRVIARSEGVMPRVSRMDVRAFVLDRITMEMSDPRYMRLLNDFLLRDCRYSGDESDFGSSEEYQRFILENPLITMNGERVKSFGEAEIADRLGMLGVGYEYEATYPVDTRTAEHGQYHPDFHITGTDIYIEYFGIDHQGNVAPFMRSSSGGDPSEEYRNGMEWKRALHRENGTKLIELFAYQHSDGDLLDSLEEQLRRCGVEFHALPPNEVYSRITGGDDRVLNSLAGQITTAIELVKGTGMPIRSAFPELGSRGERRALDRMLSILEPVYEAYQRELESKGEIDFEDMLNHAAEHVRAGRFRSPYKWIVVDEYQDISRSRYALLRALRDSSDARLFCVGDDWQSIYRFNGSDVGYILDFERWWGPSAICRIETTYRFSGSILTESNAFMNRSPRQIRKDLHPGIERGSRLEVVDCDSRAEWGRRISETVSSLPEEDSVLILGRFRHDILSLESSGFRWRPDLGAQTYSVTDRRNPGRRIVFMTIHGSKGIQADHVFVLNNVRGPYGFPDKRPEPPMVGLLLSDAGTRADEERRLFYVAITRARKAAYVMTIRGLESEFVRELDAFTDSGGSVCPQCGGTLVLRNGPYGRFMGCSNYRNGCRYVRRLRRAHIPGHRAGGTDTSSEEVQPVPGHVPAVVQRPPAALHEPVQRMDLQHPPGVGHRPAQRVQHQVGPLHGRIVLEDDPRAVGQPHTGVPPPEHAELLVRDRVAMETLGVHVAQLQHLERLGPLRVHPADEAGEVVARAHRGHGDVQLHVHPEPVGLVGRPHHPGYVPHVPGPAAHGVLRLLAHRVHRQAQPVQAPVEALQRPAPGEGAVGDDADDEPEALRRPADPLQVRMEERLPSGDVHLLYSGGAEPLQHRRPPLRVHVPAAEPPAEAEPAAVVAFRRYVEVDGAEPTDAPRPVVFRRCACVHRHITGTIHIGS